MAAHALDELRRGWLDPPGMDQAAVRGRTLTRLYNERPAWLGQAHAVLDRAVLDAYGWPRDMADEQMLARLLEINLAREPA
jgi:hypothetical protein